MAIALTKYPGCDLAPKKWTLQKRYEAKATLWFDDWEEGNNTEGPCFTDEMLQGLVRQTQTVDVSSLIYESRPPSGRSHAKSESIAREVDKAKVLAVWMI